jgi:hypothetical protein
MVARQLWELDAAGSSPATPTSKKRRFHRRFLPVCRRIAGFVWQAAPRTSFCSPPYYYGAFLLKVFHLPYIKNPLKRGKASAREKILPPRACGYV